MEELRTTAIPQYTQYKTTMVGSSHLPAAEPTPYCETLMRIVPKDMVAAGTKRDSVGWRKLARNVGG